MAKNGHFLEKGLKVRDFPEPERGFYINPSRGRLAGLARPLGAPPPGGGAPRDPGTPGPRDRGSWDPQSGGTWSPGPWDVVPSPGGGPRRG